MNTAVTGTIKELTGRLSVNGSPLTQPELSILTAIGNGTFARKVGTVKNDGKRGKPATIWEINLSAAFTMAYDSAPAVATAAPVEATVASVENASESVEASAESSEDAAPVGWSEAGGPVDSAPVEASTELSMDEPL